MHCPRTNIHHICINVGLEYSSMCTIPLPHLQVYTIYLVVQNNYKWWRFQPCSFAVPFLPLRTLLRWSEIVKGRSETSVIHSQTPSRICSSANHSFRTRQCFQYGVYEVSRIKLQKPVHAITTMHFHFVLCTLYKLYCTVYSLHSLSAMPYTWPPEQVRQTELGVQCEQKNHHE